MAKYAAAEAACVRSTPRSRRTAATASASEYGLLPYCGVGPIAPHRPGEPRDDPQLRRAASLGLPRSTDVDVRWSENIDLPRQRRRLPHPHGRGPAYAARRRRRRSPPHLRRARRLGEPHRPRPRPRGLEPGRRARPRPGNSAEFLAVYYACAKLGVVCVPVNLGWRTDEVAYVARALPGEGLAVETQLADAMGEALRGATGVTEVIVLPGLHADYRAEPADRLWVTLADREAEDTDTPTARSPTATRSRTSTPRAPPRSRRAWSRATWPSTWSRCRRRWTRAGRRPTASPRSMPMFHTAQLNAFCTPAVLVGATIHVLRGFDPAGLLDLVERERITQVFGLPMMYRAMLEHPTSPGATSRRSSGRSTRWRPCPTP